MGHRPALLWVLYPLLPFVSMTLEPIGFPSFSSGSLKAQALRKSGQYTVERHIGDGLLKGACVLQQALLNGEGI